MLTLAVQSPIPVVTVSATPTFDPTSVVQIGVSTSTAVQSVTVNWGDGTVQTFSGPATTYTHQYPILNAAYQIVVTVVGTQGATVSATPVSVSATLPTPQQAVVAGVFMSLTGQSISISGLDIGTALLNTPGGYNEIVTILLNSAQHQALVVNDLFQQYLGRPATAGETQLGVNFLQAGGTPQQIAVILAGSPEFIADAGGTAAGFANSLYLAVTNQPPTAAEVAQVATQLAAGQTPQQVTQTVLASPVGVAAAIATDISTYLGITPNAGLIGAVAPIFVANPNDFIMLLLTSPFYVQKTISA
jgi:hypothetical protein